MSDFPPRGDPRAAYGQIIWPKRRYPDGVTVTMAIHEIKDRLSSVLAQLAETGEEVEITKHGRVVALLVPPRPAGVILGLAARPDGRSPDFDQFHWSDEELQDMSGGAIFPT